MFSSENKLSFDVICRWAGDKGTSSASESSKLVSSTSEIRFRAFGRHLGEVFAKWEEILHPRTFVRKPIRFFAPTDPSPYNGGTCISDPLFIKLPKILHPPRVSSCRSNESFIISSIVRIFVLVLRSKKVLNIKNHQWSFFFVESSFFPFCDGFPKSFVLIRVFLLSNNTNPCGVQARWEREIYLYNK